MTVVLSAEQRAEALRAARGERRVVPGLRCGIRYLPMAPEPVSTTTRGPVPVEVSMAHDDARRTAKAVAS
jgi:hypothetical protein